MPGDAVVRRIRADEVEAYREIRLNALRDTPEAFGEPYADAVARPHQDYADRVAASQGGTLSVVIVAESDGALVGLIGGFLTEDQAELVSMWVAPQARRSGIARRLVEAVRDWAVEVGAHQVSLNVADNNAAAFGLYERCGFVATGEVSALRSDPSAVTLRMTMALPRAST